MKGFVSQLLSITHAQWIFCCITKHHHTNGTNALKSRKEVLTKVEQQLDKGLEGLPPEDQWLLEIDPHELRKKVLPQQQYWLLAVDAAQEAGERALNILKGATSSWKRILKDGQFAKIAMLLPTSTPLPEDKPEGARQEKTQDVQHAPSPLPEDESEEERQENPEGGAGIGAMQERTQKEQNASSLLPDDRSEEVIQGNPEARQHAGESKAAAAGASRRQGKRRKKKQSKLPSKPFAPGKGSSAKKSTSGRRKSTGGLGGLNQAPLRRQGPFPGSP